MGEMFYFPTLAASDSGQNKGREKLPQPPQPYSFTYTAGRAPGHVDHVHSETSDGSGIVRGQYSYVDPRQKVRTVHYIADAPRASDALQHRPGGDTPIVAAAKQRHLELFARIAADHARIGAERADLIAPPYPNHLLYAGNN